jgi:hypothetical protein
MRGGHLGLRATISLMESAHYAQLLHRLHDILSTLWRQSSTPHRRVVAYVEEDAQKALEDARDLLDEIRDVALARLVVYHQSLHNYHNRRVRGRSFEPGNLVLCLKQTSTSKLESPWEGPYLIHEAIPGGAYRLRNPKIGLDEKNPWNIVQLRRFYP